MAATNHPGKHPCLSASCEWPNCYDPRFLLSPPGLFLLLSEKANVELLYTQISTQGQDFSGRLAAEHSCGGATSQQTGDAVGRADRLVEAEPPPPISNSFAR